MGLFSHDSTDTAGTHHTGRDAALAGGVAHHESSTHPGRNGILGAGTVGELEHRRNEKELRDPYGSTGVGHNTHHHTGRDAAIAGGLAHHEGGQHATRNGILGAGAVGETQHLRNEHNTHGHHGAVHTGPAPLAGVHATHGAAPTIKEANKLEKKGNFEAKVGNVLHSSSMKNKAETHLAQADHLKMQASELNEAQRLEHEAGIRRQRAVGLGADPVHGQGLTGHGRHQI